MLDIDLHIDIDIKILYNLVSTDEKTGANVNVSCFIASIVIKKSSFKKWSVVGRTAPVVGRRPTMPYPGYATIFKIVHRIREIYDFEKYLMVLNLDFSKSHFSFSCLLKSECEMNKFLFFLIDLNF